LLLTLVRTSTDSNATLGQLTLEDGTTFYTLELPIKDGLAGSAIPTGTYSITITFSPHFNRLMPLINGVPNRSEIRIHPGNSARDTEGCVLVGDAESSDFIGQSDAAFNQLFPRIETAINAGEEVVITVQ
jgi:hypothetical protein